MRVPSREETSPSCPLLSRKYNWDAPYGAASQPPGGVASTPVWTNRLMLRFPLPVPLRHSRLSDAFKSCGRLVHLVQDLAH